MRNREYIIVILILGIILFTSCGKGLSPSTVVRTTEKGFDTILYSYAIVEGSRNKMTGNAGDALNFYQQALKINPQSAVAPYEISTILLSRADQQGSLKYGKLAVENEPENIWYLNNLARNYMALNYVDSTIMVLERIVTLYPEEEEVLFNLAGLYIQTGEWTKGESILRKFRIKYGDGEEIMMNLLNVLKAQGKTKETEDLLIEISQKSPEKITYQGMLAELYSERGQTEKAEAIYEGLFQNDPDNPILFLSYLDFLFEEERYQELTERINIFLINDSIEVSDKLTLLNSFSADSLFLKEYGQNLILSTMVLEANYPTNREVKITLSTIYGMVGDSESEITKLKEIVELYPNDYPSREMLLLKLNENGSNEELYALAGKVSRNFNVYPLPKLLLAYAANELGKYDEALAELSKVRILINENPEFMLQILLLEADIYYNKEIYEEAWKRYDEALLLDDSDPLVLNNYAYFLSEQDVQLRKAARMIDKALMLEKNITYLDTKAWVLFKKGKYRTALRVMKEVIGSGTTDSEILEHYGYILFKIGKCTKAVEYWQKSLEKDPSKAYLLDEIKKCVK